MNFLINNFVFKNEEKFLRIFECSQIELELLKFLNMFSYIYFGLEKLKFFEVIEY